MTGHSRYAVYTAPPPGPLADFAARWLGWDAVAGRSPAHPALPGLPRPIAEITETPRKYGFHGTIKPPFALAAGSDRAALEADLAAFARRQAPITLDALVLDRLGSFLALVPRGDATGLVAVAAATVEALDHHRAPPAPGDLARRRRAGLSPRQEALLQRWGYPYVMAEFRFHMTLTGRLPRSEAEIVRRCLAGPLAECLPRPFAIADLCLFGEAPDGRFRLLSRHKLGG